MSKFARLRRRGRFIQNRLRYKMFADVIMFFVDGCGCNNDGIFSGMSVVGEAILRKQGRAFAAVRESNIKNM